MRNHLFSLMLTLSVSLFFLSGAKAGPINWFHDDSASAAHQSGFKTELFSLDFGAGSMKTSPAFNSWLENNGYGYRLNNIYRFSNGISLVDFKNNWMLEFSEQFNQFQDGSAFEVDNFTFGAGYRLLKSKYFNAYAGLKVGESTISINGNGITAADFEHYNQPAGSFFLQNSLLLNPHLLLYRNITDNLSKRPGRISTIDAGIDAGFSLALLQGRWKYGYSDSRPFFAVPVSGVPTSAWTGFYIMGKVGWYFGRA